MLDKDVYDANPIPFHGVVGGGLSEVVCRVNRIWAVVHNILHAGLQAVYCGDV